jgi:hypothetical protein
MIVDTLVYVVAATEGLGLVGALIAVAMLYRRLTEFEARGAETTAQVLAVAQEAQEMGAAVAARLSELQQSTGVQAGKPRRGRTTMVPTEVETPIAPPPPPPAPRMPAPVTVRSVRATLDAVGPSIVMSDQDLARERGMDPLGVALQRQLSGQAIRTA